MNNELGLSLRFQDKFREDEKWRANVEQILINVKDYFYGSPRFFPEYTHHGIRHVRRTLELCDKLISEQALSEMKVRGLGILVASVLMHDIGMFIKDDGLDKIIYGAFAERKTEFLDGNTWKELWKQYLQTIERSSDKRLRKIFGEAGCPEELPYKEMAITEKNILLYGEFLRQNHGRLAYEIIKFGFPGQENLDVLRKTEIDDKIRDIIALTARSHAMELRGAYGYLEEWYAEPAKPKNIKIFYLMSVLRMADYLDAGNERAPQAVEAMSSMRSEISSEEFSWNQVIDYDDYSWEVKSESLVIDADPKCSSQFLKIESWLHGLQKELDLCWAVLGEMYTGSSPLSLTIRRVNSNILSEKTRKRFEERFVTKRAILDTNPDILKLLIHPLYNEEAKYGVRELLQNAVDACNERQEIEQQAGNTDFQPEVRVEIERGENKFTITDNGYGMTSDIIINYFLISGASFRDSEIWEKKFTKEGKSVIARSGKFGIGVLSCFLLGEHVEVTTRNVNERLGYKFSIELGRENINIERVHVPVGTRISIDSSEEVLKEIVSEAVYPKWTDWYSFQEPVVEYFLDGEEIFHEEEYVPNAEEEFEGWYKLEGTEFMSYKWSYDATSLSGINAFCNGIPVTRGVVLDAEKYGFPLKTPTISIVDYNNKVHINLSRDRLTAFPAEERFVEEGYRYVIMRLLEEKSVEGCGSCVKALQNGFACSENFKIIGNSMMKLSHFLFAEKGYTLMSPSFIKHAGVKELLLVCVKSHKIGQFALPSFAIPVWLCEVGEFRRRSFFKRAFTSVFELENLQENVVQFAVEKNFYDTELKDYFQMQGLEERLSLNKEEEKAYDFGVDGSSTDSDGGRHMTDIIQDGALAIIRYHIAYSGDSDLMESLLREYLEGIVWIPYDMAQRGDVCHKAFERLKIYAKEKKIID